MLTFLTEAISAKFQLHTFMPSVRAISPISFLAAWQVLRSIGYKSVPIDPDVPFDAGRAVIPNTKGRVTGEQGKGREGARPVKQGEGREGGL